MEKLFVDGIPLTNRGMWLGPGSYKSLLTWPALKPVQTNDWAEYNGVEVDLSEPQLSPRKISLSFVCTGEAGYERLIDEMREGSLHSFMFKELGFELNLRLIENSINGLSSRIQGVGLMFSDDEPFDGSSLPFFEATDSWRRCGVLLDDIDLGYFGVTVLNGTYKGLRAIPSIRQRLTTSSEYQNGQDYDNEGSVLMTASDATLKLLIRQPSAQMCVSAYYSLLRIMASPGEHKLCVEQFDDEYAFFYKSEAVSNVCQFLTSGLWGIAFDVTVTIIDRPTHLAIYLTNDNNGIVLMNNNNKYLTK